MTVQVLDAHTGFQYQFAADVKASISAALHYEGHTDSVGQLVALNHGCLDRHRRRQDAKTIQSIMSDAAPHRIDSLKRQFKRRQDAWEQRGDLLEGSAGGLPRDFEFIYREILKEKRRPLNMQKLFPMDGRVPLGARTHTARRMLQVGSAQVHRGGGEVRAVRSSFVEEQFETIHIVAGVETNWFETISQDFQARNTFADDTRMAIRVIEERMNRVAFNGDAISRVFGFLNYPKISTNVSTITFTPAGITADTDATIAELNRIANFPRQASGGTFRPNRMATSIRVRDALMQAPRTTGTDITVGQFFMNNQPEDGIKSIEEAHELEGVGPNGEDAIIVYGDSLDATAMVMVQPPTALPAHAINAFQNQVVYVGTIGGMVMRDLGTNAVLFVPA